VDEAGTAVDLWGAPEHPVTRGGLCGKVDRYVDRTYHRDRLTHPLVRVGPKGSGQFKPVDWDTAIALIATRLTEVIEVHGAQAVLPFSYSGTLGVLQGEGMPGRFFHALGASQLARTICAEAGSWGMRYTCGTTSSVDPMDAEFSELIVLWGTNTLSSNLHFWPVVLRAKKRGARVIVIDPVETKTAKAADEWIRIRPGTDAALALAMMHVLITESLVDEDYIREGTVGFEELAAKVEAWTPDRAAKVTGIPSAAIVALARSFAAANPALVRINYGMQRHRGGGMAVRTIACLPALTGHWRRRGGGVLLSTSAAFELESHSLRRPDLMPTPQPRTVNMIRLGDALAGDETSLRRALYRPRPTDPEPATAGPPIKALFVYNSNPAASNPDLGKVRAGLANEDLFTVVLEHFQTDTADYADVVLPATTQLEHWDLHASYGHMYLSLNRPAIAPVGQALSNAEIFRRLGRRMNLDASLFSADDEATLKAYLSAQTSSALASISWERLTEEGFARLDVPTPFMPFAEGKFPTPSGRCELYSETMKTDGYSPTPEFIEPAWMDELTEDALVCVSPPAHLFLNSTFVNVDRLRVKTGAPRALMNPTDATRRSLGDEEEVEVIGSGGRVRMTLRVRDAIVPGTICIEGIHWPKLTAGGRGVNELTLQRETDFGGGATFYDVTVRVQRADDG
jgi:anaerobic selenocysteine-containing dehydrogenase